jgi:UrcA family protein
MNTDTCLSRRLIARYSTVRPAIVAALLAVAPAAAIADQPTTATADPRIADVSLADLNLSSAEGMGTARNRLLAMAQRVCAEAGNGRDLSSEPNFAVCVESTLAGHLKQINALGQNKVSVRDSVTRAANVSLADLDLSTLEGSRVARERLEAMARRLCAELTRSRELAYQPELAYQSNFAACVHDTLTGALAQANALRAAKESRFAQRAAP